MKHFLIYVNQYKDRNLYTAKRICDYLKLKGQRATIAAADEEEERREGFPADCDMMIVLGGDGTMLRAVRDTKGLHIPIIGALAH